MSIGLLFLVLTEFCDTDADKVFGLWGIPFDISSTNSVAGAGSWFSDGKHSCGQALWNNNPFKTGFTREFF